MSDPPRLFDNGNEFEQRLLRSAKRDRMSPTSKAALMTAVATGTGALLLSGTAAAKGSKFATLALLKWAGIGIASVALVAGGSTVIRRSANSRTQTERTERFVTPMRSAQNTIPETQASHELPMTGSTSDSTAVLSDDPARERPSNATSVPPKTRTPETTVRPVASIASRKTPELEPAVAKAKTADESASLEPDISSEMKTLATAQHALTTGNAAGALHILEAHERDHAVSPLAQERTVLHIEALAAMGRTDAARALAAKYHQAFPSSPYAKRVAASIAGGSP